MARSLARNPLVLGGAAARTGIAGLMQAERRALAEDLHALANQIRAAERREETSDSFNDGVTWALLWIENTANRLTETRPVCDLAVQRRSRLRPTTHYTDNPPC
ncbi:hypothetical protein [Streptomyces sp. NPDC005953]|uniref:hypothetical protein n=1 Tax=Streptomyces sp. NPDC005953 TaxID=3156719 RepID=UPI003404DA15